MNTRVVIPAAGQARRMGQCKSLLKVGEQTLIAYQVSFLNRVGLTDICVVHNGLPALKHECDKLKVTQFNGEGKLDSMLESVRLALHASSDLEHMLILPSDSIPYSEQVFLDVLQRAQENRTDIVVPIYQGKKGHPIMIPSLYFDSILQSLGEEGLRGLFKLYPDQIQTVTSHCASVRANMNTPEDYRRWLAVLSL